MTRCKHCSQEVKATKLLAEGGFIKTFHSGPGGSTVHGVEELFPVKGEPYEGYPRCPECETFLGAKSLNSENTMHKHICPKCGWESGDCEGAF